MTKDERIAYNSMVLNIAKNMRKSFYPLGRSKTKYVMVPLGDVLTELNIFTNYIKKKT